MAKILLSLGYDKFLVVAPNTKTVSDKSYYNFRSRGIRQDSLRYSMIRTGKGKNNFQLVNVMVNHIDDELTYLNRLAKLKPSFMGVQVIDPQSFLRQLKRCVRKYRIYGEVEKIEKKGGYFIIKALNHTIFSKKLVFCSGGNRADFSKSFSDEHVAHNALELAQSIGCETKLLSKIMYHPFYSKAVCIPSDSLADFTVVNEKGKVLTKTNKLLQAHNAHHCFEDILREFKQNGRCFAVKGSTKIELTPQPHYRLGGIQVNKHGQTSIKNVYALGECSSGMHGYGRIGGCALSEIIVMARVIGKKLAGLDKGF